MKKGWRNYDRNQSKRHSNAKKYGKAGGLYAKPKSRFKTTLDSDRDGKMNLHDCKPYDASKQDFGMSKEQQKAVEEYVDSKAVNNYDEDRGNVVEFENGEEWLIFDSYDDAENQARDYVKEQLDDEPENFVQDWLNEFTYISDTDKRLLAGDLTDSYASDIRDEDDGQRLIEESGFDYEKFQKLSDKKKEEMLDKAEEKLRDEMYDDALQSLERDAKDYLVNEQGIYTEEEYLKQSFVQIDTEQASINAINTDGVAHFLSTYDGNEVELKDGSVMYRTN